MSTFFEKLAASRPKASDSAVVTVDLGVAQATPHPVALSESHSSIFPTAGEDTAEEEGELTVDIYDKDDAIIIQSTVAGVKPEDLEVSITSDMVSIKGTRQPIDHIPEERYYYKELFWGTFARTVILPEEIDEHHTEATLKHGLLTIMLPKKKKGLAHAQKVKIKTV